MGLPECKECPENFNPRAPRGARHFANVERKIDSVFQSTRPSRGATAKAREIADRYYISIHAPLAGRDSCSSNCLFISSYFNPRAPRGARPPANLCWCSHWIFQSTRPSRGATTPTTLQFRTVVIFQSTRPSRGATQLAKLLYDNQKISIHAPLAGRDSFCWSTRRIITNFNPRAPRGARLCRLARL